MEALREVTRALESMLVHKPGYTNDNRVYVPDESDLSPAAELKRQLVDQALAVYDAAQARLSGSGTPNVNPLLGTESDRIEEALGDDPYRRWFHELIRNASVAQELLSERD